MRARRRSIARRSRGRRCYVGLDLSSTTDLTALVAVFPDETGFDVLAQCFVPAERIRGPVAARPGARMTSGRANGWVTAIPGAAVDYEVVRQALRAWCAEFDVQLIAYDPWNATDLVSRLEKQDGLVVRADAAGVRVAVGADEVAREGGPRAAAPARWAPGAALVRQQRRGGKRPGGQPETVESALDGTHRRGRRAHHGGRPDGPERADADARLFAVGHRLNRSSISKRDGRSDSSGFSVKPHAYSARPVERAYSLLEIKSVAPEGRRFSGIASTPELDRQGDSFDPAGVDVPRIRSRCSSITTRSSPSARVTLTATPDGILFDATMPDDRRARAAQDARR